MMMMVPSWICLCGNCWRTCHRCFGIWYDMTMDSSGNGFFNHTESHGIKHKMRGPVRGYSIAKGGSESENKVNIYAMLLNIFRCSCLMLTSESCAGKPVP